MTYTQPVHTSRLRSVWSVMFGLVLFMLSSVSSLFAAEFVAGKDYKELAVQDKIDGDNVIVREFFWYGCPHCYNLEPYIKAWEKTKPADVNFVRTPAPLNPVWETSARGYYAAQILGVADKTHTALLHAIHQKNQRPFSKTKLADFYAQYGANKSAFLTLYNSTQVDKKVRDAYDAMVRYELAGVPALVINGRFIVRGAPDKRTFDIVDYLIQKIRDEKTD